MIDEAIAVSDLEAVEMSRYLVKNDGLFLGSSSCVNLCAAVKLARKMGKGRVIFTFLCDHGSRHLTKFWNDEYLRNSNLEPKAEGLEFLR